MRTCAVVALAILPSCVEVDANTTVASGVEVEVDALQTAPPPPAMTISSSGPLYIGETQTLTVTGAPAGGKVFYVASRAASGSLFCPPGLAPECMGLYQPMSVITTDPADPSGLSSIPVTWGPGLAPGPMNLQAAAKHLGVPYTSQVLDGYVLHRDGDVDGDGLTNESEYEEHLTDPLNADTDGGGTDDGTEVASGLDPLNPADDPDSTGCLIDFASAYANHGDGGSPALEYGDYGVHPIHSGGYGLIGGDLHGDPGDWSDPDTVPDEAWGLHDFGSTFHDLFFTFPVTGVSLDAIRPAGDSTVTVTFVASRFGVITETKVVTLTEADPRETLIFEQELDEIAHHISGPEHFAYVIDNLRYTTDDFDCPP